MEKVKKYAAAALSIIIAAFSMAGCSLNSELSSDKTSSASSSQTTQSDIDTSISAADLDVGYDESASCSIALSGTTAEISGSGAELSDGDLHITAAGTYILSGELSDGQIIVDADKESEVKLVFSGVKVSCSDNAALFINKAAKVTVTLEADTENTLTDGSEYSLDEDTENVDGAVFSRCDLTFNGTGKLTVNANYKHGIVCKDALVIAGGEYEVTSVGGGIYGKDSVKINDGTFTVNAGTNGIKSSNSEDADKGFIYIAGGTFNITAGGDGIEAETVLTVEDGDITVTTGGGSANASMKSDGTPNEDWGQWGGGGNGGMTPPDMPQGNGGDTSALVETTAAADTDTETDTSTTEESSSAKGLKAETELNISGGTLNIDSSDDSIHCNGTVNITGGSITACSGDDGVHADSDTVVSGGSITIEKSYEGLEGKNVTVSGGDISIVSSDDGINAAGGSDTGSTDRPGMDGFDSSSGDDHVITISGGNILVNAGGDGLDSNGNLIVSGGTIYVNGPTDNGNGAIDKGDNGSAWITGGTIIAVGSSGMAETFAEENSTQVSVLLNLSEQLQGGTELTITDSSGNVIASFTPEKTYNSIVFSTPDMKQGETYTITSGDTTETVTADSLSTTSGNGGFGGGGMNGQPGGGGMGGQPGGMGGPNGGNGGMQDMGGNAPQQ